MIEKDEYLATTVPIHWLAFALMWLTVATASSAQADGPTPYLVLDAGGHTAAVNKVLFTPDGQRLISVSNDKTVRIWDVGTGESLYVLRPPIGEGAAGMLYAATISPDGRLLAVAGFEYPGNDHGIFVVSLANRRIEKVLRGHTNVVLDLAFSPDGRILASASADRTVCLWDMTDYHVAATLRGHRDDVYAVAFSPDGQSLATGSLDETGRIWSVQSHAETATLRGHSGAIQAIAWSGDGQILATGSVDQTINLWSADGHLLHHTDRLGNHVTSIHFTSRPRELFYTLGGPGDLDGGFILSLADNRSRHSFSEHGNSVLHGSLAPDGLLAATADANGEIALWRIHDGLLVHRLRSHGWTPWSTAWDTETGAIAWGYTSEYIDPNHRGPIEYVFQISDLQFAEPVASRLRQAVTSAPPVAIAGEDNKALNITRAGQSAAAFKLDNSYDQIRCFTLLDENTAAVGSDFGLVLVDTLHGRKHRALKGHSGTVWAVAASPDGRYLLSSGEDQTLRVWSWQDGQLLVSLFFAGHEWIAWTPAGYYAASVGGERLMGWLVSDGGEQLGQFHPAAHFRASLYRPDVIRRLLEAGNTEQALIQIAFPDGQNREPANIEQVLPPIIQILEPLGGPVEVPRSTLQVVAKARSRSEHPITTLRLLLDGRPYEGRKGLYVVPANQTEVEGEAEGTWTVTLVPGQHTLAVQAETTASKAVSEAVEVIYSEPRGAEQPRLPDLYVLAIGVSAYPSDLQLEYAAKDARIFANTLKEVSTNLFRNVAVHLLIDGQAQRRDIMSELTRLRREMTQQDIAVFFFSGHGAKDETGGFYLVPVDAAPSDLMATGISGTQFKDALAAIPGRVLVLLDACHAGAAGGDRRKAASDLADDLIRDLVTDDYGIIVMCSSMGREYSMESDEHQQGYFTLALVEALTGKADFNRDGLVYLTEVDTYLSDRVKSLTQGQQHPVTTKPATIRSFPLSKL